MEKQLARDLLFRRFSGLGLDAPLPDHSTLWRFRELLIKKRLLSQHKIPKQPVPASDARMVRLRQPAVIKRTFRLKKMALYKRFLMARRTSMILFICQRLFLMMPAWSMPTARIEASGMIGFWVKGIVYCIALTAISR